MIYLYVEDEISVEGCTNTDDLSILDNMGYGKSKVLGCIMSKEGSNFKYDKIKYICLSDKKDSFVISMSKMNHHLMDILKSKRLCVFNAKHFLPFLYEAGIFHTKVYCPQVIEGILSMGTGEPVSLAHIASKYGVEYISRTKDNNPYNGLNAASVSYMVSNAIAMVDIRDKQIELSCKTLQLNACILETKVIPVIAYIKWCGVSMDNTIFKKALDEASKERDDARNILDEYVLTNYKNDKKLCNIECINDLFEGVRNVRECLIKWENEKSVDKLMDKIDDKEERDKVNSMISDFRSLAGIVKSFRHLYNESSSESKIYPEYTQITGYGRISPVYKTINRYGNEEDLPVIMNMPKRFRDCIKPMNGNVFISSDWKSQEMRVVAHISGDKKLLSIIKENEDVHSYIAKMILGKKLKGKSDQEIKDIGKKLNFGLIYGGGIYALSKIGLTGEEAMEVKKRYFSIFKGIDKYQESMSSMVITRGYIAMNGGYGYRYYIKNIDRIRAAMQMVRAKGFWKSFKETKASNPDSHMVTEAVWYLRERDKLANMAYNAPVQNYGSIMLKNALCSIFNKIVSSGYEGVVRIVLPQHDSITIECPAIMSEVWKEELRNSMICPDGDEYSGYYPVDIEVKDSL